MPLKENLKKVLVIGSGPIVIGQAAEFDYAGTQACRAIKEEGIKVILLNSNPATIMTDTNIADQVYIEPMTVDTVKKILQKEKPDGIIANLGGQVGLNLALALDRRRRRVPQHVLHGVQHARPPSRYHLHAGRGLGL